jgi:hypothetical protein
MQRLLEALDAVGEGHVPQGAVVVIAGLVVNGDMSVMLAGELEGGMLMDEEREVARP